MLDCFMFFGAPFEICDPTLVHSEGLLRGPTPGARPVWLTPFFSQPSVLPRPQLLSFDNHLDCLCLVLVFFTSAVSLFSTPVLFEGCSFQCSFAVRGNSSPYFSTASALFTKTPGCTPSRTFLRPSPASPLRRYTIESAAPRHSRDSSPRLS